MKELLPFERQMLLAEVYHYAWYNEDAYKDLLTFIEKYSTVLEKPVFFNPINNIKTLDEFNKIKELIKKS